MNLRSTIRRLRRSEPDVERLHERGDLDGLVAAACFRKPQRAPDGRYIDRGAQVRKEAILALGELGPDAGNGTIASALRDPFDSVRSAAIAVLYVRGDALELADALSWLPAGQSLSLAAQAVLELRTTPVVRATARSLICRPGDGPLPESEVQFLLSLTRSDTECRPLRGVVRELLTALRGTPGVAADRAEDLLVRLAPQSTPSIIAELERGGSAARAAAMLGRIGDPHAVEPLIEALDHVGSSVRVEAARALGQLRDPRAVEPLLRSTRDLVPEVRATASRALDEMGTAAVIVGVAALLRPTLANGSPAALEQHNGGLPASVDSVSLDTLAAAIAAARADIDSKR
jgi:HEAT repeat protein